MSIQVLLDALAGPDGEGKMAARQALIDAGAEAVGPLVATLLDEDSPVAWHDAGSILRRIGRPAFAPLVEAIASAPTDETRRRCGWAFVGFGPDLVDAYAEALSRSLTVAEAMSVSPASLGPHTTLRGHGVLALTRRGRKHGVPAGALPI